MITSITQNKKIKTEKLENTLIKNIVKNLSNDLKRAETNTIERALYSEEVKESKRIARNVNLLTIKNLKTRAKRLSETKKNIKGVVKMIEEEEKQMMEQIRVIQKQLDKQH